LLFAIAIGVAWYWSAESTGRAARVVRPPTPAGGSTRPVEASAPSERPSPVEGDDSVALTVRDLWGGGVVPELAVRGRSGEDVWRARADERGVFTVPMRALLVLEGVESEDRRYAVASAPADVRGRREIWCFRRTTIRGRVLFDGGTGDLSSVEVTLSPARLRGNGTSGTWPGSAQWAKSNRVRFAESTTPLTDGAFVLDAALVGDAAVIARAPGWRSAWDVLDADLAAARREVVLVLRRSPVVAGVLRDADGTPLQGERVHVYVFVRSKDDELDADSLGRLKEGGFTAARSRKRAWARHKLHYSAVTDDRGRWEVAVDAAGHAHVFASSSGRLPVELDLGPVDRVDGPIHLVAERGPPRRIRFLAGSAPLADAQIVLIDLRFEACFRYEMRADGAGTVVSAWPTPGRWYQCLTDGVFRGFFRYDGQPDVDVEACERNVQKVLDAARGR
jgi:hypothetical protein